VNRFPEADFLTSAHRPDQFVPDEGRELAFAGRSNSGKSSAINAALHRRDLARTSKTPGRTQLVNFFSLGGDRRLVDLPGYGYARVSRTLQQHWRGLLEAYLERGSLAGLVLVIDSRRGILEGDEVILDWCGAAQCPVHILLTKADKLTRNAAAQVLREVRAAVARPTTVQLFSAVTRQGVDDLQGRMLELLQS
jgi:GTP-binding protein